jgi:hypothetical protein
MALENNHGSITAAQKAGRQATKTTADTKSGSELELVNALVTATNTVSAASNVLASSRLVRQPQGRASPDLPVVLELVKKTRKRKALVEDHEEVDIGPRKLRSRK